MILPFRSASVTAVATDCTGALVVLCVVLPEVVDCAGVVVASEAVVGVLTEVEPTGVGMTMSGIGTAVGAALTSVLDAWGVGCTVALAAGGLAAPASAGRCAPGVRKAAPPAGAPVVVVPVVVFDWVVVLLSQAANSTASIKIPNKAIRLVFILSPRVLVYASTRLLVSDL